MVAYLAITLYMDSVPAASGSQIVFFAPCDAFSGTLRAKVDRKKHTKIALFVSFQDFFEIEKLNLQKPKIEKYFFHFMKFSDFESTECKTPLQSRDSPSPCHS